MCLPCGCWAGAPLLACRECAHTAIDPVKDFQRPLAIVTGGTAGVGLATARHLATTGRWKVVIAGRTLRREGVHAQTQVSSAEEEDEKLLFVPLDLSKLASVRAFKGLLARALLRKAGVEDETDGTKVSRRKRGSDDSDTDSGSTGSNSNGMIAGRHVALLINNAGVMGCPYELTEDGFERQMATNHIGHFLLTLTLIPHMSDTARIVNIASNAHYSGPKLRVDRLPDYGGKAGKPVYDPWNAYVISKYANVLFTYELQRRFRMSGSRIQALVVHPGVLRSALWQHGTMGPLGVVCICKCPGDGALPVYDAATSKRFSGPPRSLIMTADNTEEGKHSSQSVSMAENAPLPVLTKDGEGRLLMRHCCCTLGAATDPGTYDDELQLDFWQKSLQWVGLNAEDDVPVLVRYRDDRRNFGKPSLLWWLVFGPGMTPCGWSMC